MTDIDFLIDLFLLGLVGFYILPKLESFGTRIKKLEQWTKQKTYYRHETDD